MTTASTAKPTHRLAAIMFTDIVGYTALMAHDEPKALHVLEKNRQLLKAALRRFDGKLLKEVGDGTLSRFRSANWTRSAARSRFKMDCAMIPI